MRRALLIAALPMLLAFVGCIGHADIADEVDSITWDLRPLDVDTEIELSVGRGVLGLATTVARFVDDPDAELAADVIDEIDEVHVGVYTIHGSRRDAPVDLGLDAREELADLGWTMVVRSRDRYDEATWVMTRPTGKDRVEVLVISFEDEELAVVKLQGDLGGIVDAAIRGDDGLLVAAHDWEDHGH